MTEEKVEVMKPDIYPELYLGLKQPGFYDYKKREWVATGNAGLDTEKFPLAFATHYPGKQTKEFLKRKETVDRWASDGNYYNKSSKLHASVYVKNDPVEGFEFFDVEERWRTSNKWFCVKDPRGFHLQVSAANLLDILVATIVDHGKIQGPCVWGRFKGQNVLVPLGTKTHAAATSPRPDSVKDFVPGMIYKINYGDEYIYLGKKKAFTINVWQQLWVREVLKTDGPFDKPAWRPPAAFAPTYPASGSGYWNYPYNNFDNSSRKADDPKKWELKLESQWDDCFVPVEGIFHAFAYIKPKDTHFRTYAKGNVILYKSLPKCTEFRDATQEELDYFNMISLEIPLLNFSLPSGVAALWENAEYKRLYYKGQGSEGRRLTDRHSHFEMYGILLNPLETMFDLSEKVKLIVANSHQRFYNEESSNFGNWEIKDAGK